MDAQLDLFKVANEKKLTEAATLQELPEEARAKVRDLFAALAIKPLQTATERNQRDESQREN